MGTFFTLLGESHAISMLFIPTVPVFFQMLPFRCESLIPYKSLNAGTEEIFPCRILEFGRHFERVEKLFNFSTRDPEHLHAYAHSCMAHFCFFFLKIDFLVQHMGKSPQVKITPRYGLHP